MPSCTYYTILYYAVTATHFESSRPCHPRSTTTPPPPPIPHPRHHAPKATRRRPPSSHTASISSPPAARAVQCAIRRYSTVSTILPVAAATVLYLVRMYVSKYCMDSSAPRHAYAAANRATNLLPPCASSAHDDGCAASRPCYPSWTDAQYTVFSVVTR